MERVLWYLIAGTRGGYNRARILRLLANRPHNAHQVAEGLSLNYKSSYRDSRLDLRGDMVKLAFGGEPYGLLVISLEPMHDSDPNPSGMVVALASIVS